MCSQHQDKVDFVRAEVLIEPIPHTKSIKGEVAYEFEVLENVDSLFLDAHHMSYSKVLLDLKEVRYDSDGNRINIHAQFKKGRKHILTLVYEAQPKQTVYFLGWDDKVKGNEQIWTQGQGKYTSHWLPSFDDMNEKIEFDISIIANAQSTVLTNGKFLNKSTVTKEGKVTHRYDMENPMSSYLLAFVIGTYRKQTLLSKSETPIYNYYYPKDSARVEPTFRYTKRIFDFLENEIGVAYPWQNYKQVPVHDFLYAGMENTGTTVFADGYMIDATAFVDKNYVNVNAHEMAHQWFGNLVTEENGEHHWLHEGFATYYAYLAEKAIFGDDHYFWKLYRSWKQLEEVAQQGKGQSLLDPKASSLVFYEKGALALHMLRDEVGDAAFQLGIRNFLDKYRYSNVQVDDFLTEMANASNQDLQKFKASWLVDTQLPSINVKVNLAKHSPSLKALFKMESDLNSATTAKVDFETYWNETRSVHLRSHMIRYYSEKLSEKSIEAAFATDTVKVRQALALLSDIKQLPRAEFETLLNDASYVTIENALLQLWLGYPEDRARYLDKTKGVIGFPNKNIRLLWLTLAVLTNGYEPSATKQYFDELSGYTSPVYSFEIRRISFEYLKEAFGFTDKNLLDLIDATEHHSWQFKKFARNLLDELIKDTTYKERITGLMDELKPSQKKYVGSKLPME